MTYLSSTEYHQKKAEENYNFEGCGIGVNSRGGLRTNGGTPDADCAGPSLQDGSCKTTTTSDLIEDIIVERLPESASWPGSSDPETPMGACQEDNTGKLSEFLTYNPEGSKGEYLLDVGVLCITEDDREIFKKEFEGKGRNKVQINDKLVSMKTQEGQSNTLIFNKDVEEFKDTGNGEITIYAPTDGDFEGVTFYAPYTDLILRGTVSLNISCFGLVVRNFEFSGNVKVTATCNESDPNYVEFGSGPRLIE